MRHLLRAAALAALALHPATPALAQSGSGGKNKAEHLDKPYVIMISFDGFRHDYVDRVETPNFDRIARAGVRADGLIPIFPSKTFPNHYAIATGMYAENHGLIDNSFWDPEFQARYALGDRATVEDGRWYGGEPIWVTAETQGMVAATYFFVGSEAPVSGVRPSYYHIYDASIPNEARVDQVIEWLRLPEAERPHLVMLYFSDVDNAGHTHGPDAAEVDEAVRAVDRALGRLLDGIESLPIRDRIHVILVSDHGMAALDTARAERLDAFVDLEGVRIFGNGPYATLWVGDSARVEAIRAALAAGLKHARVYRRDEIPERYRYKGSRRVGDLLVLAEPGWQVYASNGRAWSGGTHGYDPVSPLMHGIFFAMGPSIRAGVRIPAFENVHVYPLVAHLLGLRPNPAVDGRLDVLRPILR